MTQRRRVELLGGLLLIILLWLIVYPLILVLIEGFSGPAGWTLDFVRLFFQQRNEAQALWGSLWISLVSVVLAAVIGIPLAFLFGATTSLADRCSAGSWLYRLCFRRWWA